jgi:peptide/nickel transport system permease protein
VSGYLIRRIAGAVPLLLGVLTLTFVLLELAPGDAVDLWVAESGTVPEDVRALWEERLDLDASPPERYVNWLWSVVRGDLGWSQSRGRSVARAIGDALPATLLLSGAALLMHVLIGIALGLLAAARHGRWIDRLVTLGGLTLYAMPTFWLALMAVLALSYGLGLFPAGSMRSVTADEMGWLGRGLDLIWHLALPAGVLGIASAAAMTRFVRGGLLAALGEEFVRAARARGAGGRRVLLRHALRNALLPVINLVGLSLPILVSGSLVTEVVFAWPGMGRLTYDAALADDRPLVLAATLLAALMVIVGNLLADVSMALADPRIRLVAAKPDGRRRADGAA